MPGTDTVWEASIWSLRILGLSSVEKRRLRDNLTAFCSFLRRQSTEGGAGLFSLVTKNRTYGNSTKLFQCQLRLDNREKFFAVRVVKHWERLLHWLMPHAVSVQVAFE